MDPTSNPPSNDSERSGTRSSRSGTAVARSVVPYEPDPDTVFEDDTCNVYESEESIGNEEDFTEAEVESDNSAYSSEEESDETDLETELESEIETSVTEGYMEDAVDWDQLTNDALSCDESEDDIDDMDSDDVCLFFHH